MDGLVIDLDLNDDHTRVCCCDKEKSQTIPTIICRRGKEEVQLSGEEAYAVTLLGEGVIVDKPLRMMAKDGVSTIRDIYYGGGTPSKLFIGEMLGYPGKESGIDEVARLVIIFQSVDCGLFDTLTYCADCLGILRGRVHVISHVGGLICYVLDQKKELWTNQVGLSELSGERLCYYEMKVQGGIRCNMVQVKAQNQGETFSLDILDSPSDNRLADKILTACGEKLLNRKLFSVAFPTGKGSEYQGWADGFMRLIYNWRKVFAEPCFFTRGVAFKGADYTHQKTSYPCIFICEGRLKAKIPLKVTYKGRESQLVVASYGDNRYEFKSPADLIVDGQEKIEFIISLLDSKKRKLVKIPLAGFPEHPPEATRIELKVAFTGEGTMTMSIRGKGFGELLPSSGAAVKQEMNL